MQRKHSSKLKEYDPKVCNQCGMCCHVSTKINDDKKVLVRGAACMYLRPDGNVTRCAVYKDRFTKASWCMSVSEAYDQNKLPNSCPYVKDDPDYKGTNYTEKTFEDVILPHVLLQIVDTPVQIWRGPTGE